MHRPDHTAHTITSRLTPARVLSYIGSVAALRILVKLAGFGEKMTLVAFLGIKDTDVFWIALSVPLTVFFTVSAVTAPTMLPMFVRRLRHDDGAGAWSQLHAWLLVLFPILAILAFLGFHFADGLASLLAPGFDADRHAQCVSMLRIMIPLSAPMGLLPLLGLALNAQRKFAVVPIAEFFMRVCMIGALLLLAKGLGMSAALWGAALGIVAALAIQTSGLKSSWRLRDARPFFSDPDFRLVGFLMLAPGFGALFSRFGGLVENAACSTLAEGSVTALELARKIINLPLLIIPLATGTVLLTLFSELNQRGDRESMARMLTTALHTMAFLFVPITVLTCVLAHPIIAVVYQRGQFGPESVALVAPALRWMTPIMCLLSIEMLVMKHFASRLDLWPPVLIGVVCVLLRVGLIALSLRHWHWGLAGVVMSIVASRCVKVSLLLLFLRIRGGISLTQMRLADLLRLLPGAVAAGLIAYGTLTLLGPVLDTSTLSRLVLLAVAGGTGALAYFALAHLLKCPAWHYILRNLKWPPSRLNQSA